MSWRHFGRGPLGNVFRGGFGTGYFRRRYQLELFSVAPQKAESTSVMYQLGWATLPGLRGLSVGEFRATPTAAPDHERGVALEFANEAERDSFLQQLETNFAPRRFTNAADAFDTVKAYVLERAAKGI